MSEYFKVIVAGGRDFDDYELMKKKLDNILQNKTNIQIVSGTARGADRLGERYAEERGYSIKRFPADWKNHGLSAGPIRNERMAKYSDACACFWNGISSGTASMIRLSKKYKLKHLTVRY